MSARMKVTDRDLSRIVQRSLRNWELAREVRRRTDATPPPVERPVADFVAVSRLAWAGGHEFAERLAAHLGWPMFDKEILQAMAGDDAVRQTLYESMDERDLNWYEETLRSLISRDHPRNDYFHQLCRTVLCLARQSQAVFLGRGADLILPRDCGLRIRIVAPLEWRARRHAEAESVNMHDALQEIHRIDAERDEFLRRHFGPDASSPVHYDLLVNRAQFTPEQIVSLVSQALRLRGIG